MIGLLGPVRLVDHGADLGGAKQRGVLACLALRAGRPVGVDALVAAVWGEDPPRTVRNTVQVYVSGLRRALAPSGVAIDRVGAAYILRAGLDDVDASRFAGMVAAGGTALRAGEPHRAVAVLAQAMELWGGEPFTGLDEQPFVAAARAALEDTHVSARIDLGTALGAVGRPAEAATVAEEVVVQRPYDEAGWALLMTALYHSGRAPDALAAYSRARAVLVDDLGVDPSPRLVALHRAVLEHTLPPPVGDLAPEEAVAPAIAGALPAAVTDLVGRSDLVAEVVGLLGAGTRLVTLHGLGGIGKTALALAIGRQLLTEGYDVRFADVAAVRDAAVAAAVVCRAAGRDPGDDPVAALAAVQAVLVVDNAEQVERFGPVVADLLRRCPGVCVLVTSRTTLGIRGERLVPVLALRGGEPGSSAVDLLQRRVRDGGRDTALPAAVAVRLCALAGGVPLAIEIVACTLHYRDPARLLAELERRTLLDLSGPGDLPDRQRTVGTVLAWTVERLSPSALAVLVAASPVAGPIGHPMLDVLAGEPELDAALEELARAALLDGPDSEGRYRPPVPVADYVRTAYPTAIGPARQRVVTAVVDRLADEAALLSEPATVDTAAAIALDGGDVPVAVALLVGLRRYWLATGRTTEALRMADTVAGWDLDPAATAVVALARGQYASWVDRDDAADLLRRGLADRQRLATQDPLLVVNSWCYLGSWHVKHGEYEAADDCAVRAAAGAGTDADLADLARDFRAYVAAHRGDHETALALSWEGLAAARRRDDTYVVVDLLFRLAEQLVELDRAGEADALLTEAYEIARTTPVGALLPHLLVLRVSADVVLGRTAAALGAGAEGLRLLGAALTPALRAALLRAIAAALVLADETGPAGRLTGAARTLLSDAGLPVDSMWIESLRRVVERGHGSEGFAAAAAAGAVDPDRTVRTWLAQQNQVL